jgi:hypothetical protein
MMMMMMKKKKMMKKQQVEGTGFQHARFGTG